MSEYLYHYHPVEPATWFYLSSLLMIGLFFKFSRLWSVRNLDLLLLIMLAPGMLFIYYGGKLDRDASVGLQQAKGPPATAETAVDQESDSSAEEVAPAQRTEAEGAGSDAAEAGTGREARSTEPESAAATGGVDGQSESQTQEPTRGQQVQLYGYLWLFFSGGLLLIRLLSDATMVRRPLLEPNLSAGGLAFIGCSLFVFLTANVISRPAAGAINANSAALVGDQQAADQEVAPSPSDGPGYALLARLPSAAHKGLAIFAHLAIVVGMVLIGHWHFDNIVMGIGAATMYLMLPYTALMTNEITHALPAACLVWAVLCYRRPLAAGICFGLACGVTYYPLFLLPLWCSFYWPRGLLRFVMGITTMLVVLLFVLFSSHDVVQNIRLMFGLYSPAMDGLRGVWDSRLGGWSGYYRIPVLAAFIALASSMALWPAQKNLGTLLSCSAAVMVATQFWHGYGGGTYIAWYLPLLLLTIFRPNLEDRVALTVLTEGWLPRRLSALPSGKAA